MILSGKKDPEKFIEAFVLKLGLEIGVELYRKTVKKKKVYKIDPKALENEWM